MGLWSRLFGRERKGTQDVLREIYGGRTSASGETVNALTALQVSTVMACVRVKANGLAQVPFRLYRAQDGRRAVATDHPLSDVLHRRPNPWQTSYELRETTALHLSLAGNAFAFINRVGRDREVRELIPIQPGNVTVDQRPDYSLVYRVRSADRATEQEFPAEAIWHLRGPSWNSWFGLEAVKLARDAIGLAMAMERTSAEFQRNGAKVSGLLTVQNKLSSERYTQLRGFLARELDAGAGGSGGWNPLILDDGAKFEPFAMTGVDAQHLETRRHQVEEICRAFGVMPIMIGHADKTATYASAEQMFLAHVIHTLAPWYERVEQSADVNLLTDDERREGYYAKFTPNALLRGAAADRAAFYAAALGTTQQPGWMTQNEVRELEDLDPIDGGDDMTPLITQAAAPQGNADGTN